MVLIVSMREDCGLDWDGETGGEKGREGWLLGQGLAGRISLREAPEGEEQGKGAPGAERVRLL